MGIYFYGIVELERPLYLEDVGIAAERAYIIRYRDIGALVSQIPEGYKVALEEALIHEGFLQRVMERDTLIPMSFGTIVETPKEIKKILKRGYMTFKNTINRLRGRIQVNVKASWKEKAVLNKLLTEDRKIRDLRKRMVMDPTNQSLRVKLGRRVKGLLDERRRRILPAVIATLQDLSDDFEENRTKDINTILIASFLLEKNREQDFYAKVDELEGKHSKEIEFVAVGPLPPYNFTRIEIRNVDSNAVEEAQKILGLAETSNISEIRQAFNHLAQSYHPDLHPQDTKTSEKFGRIRKSYDVLTEYCEHRLFSFEKSDVEDTIIIRARPN